MRADRHIFVVREQWVVGAELLADVGRVMNADVEVRVVADEAGHVHPDLALPDQLRLDIVTIALVAQQFLETQAQGSLRLMTPRQPAVQHRLRQVVPPVFVEEVGDRGEVEHEIADRDAGAAPALTDRKDAERQVLDREIASLSSFAPTGERRVVALVDHGSLALGKPCQAMS